MMINGATATSAVTDSFNFVLDGVTTYCWQVDTSIYSNTVDATSVHIRSAEGANCPLELSIAIPSGDVHIYDSVDISWNATKRVTSSGALKTNAFGVTSLSAGLDRILQEYYEITTSHLQTCPFNTNCNPVTAGSQMSGYTTNTPLNFTGGLAAFESSELRFDSAGTYTVVAHLIMPSNEPLSKRYDFAVFLKVQVLARSTAALADTVATPYSESRGRPDSSGMSTQLMCLLIISGIVVAALAVIGFVTLRSKIDRGPEAGTNKRNLKHGRGMFGFSATGIQSGSGPVGDSDVDAEEFAMLSMHEATVHHNRGSTYLSALGRGRRSSAALEKKCSPIKFAGPVQCLDRKSSLDENASSMDGDVTPQSITIETPGTGRASYTGMDDTPKNAPVRPYTFDQARAPPGQIMFNDIMEDEVISSRSRPSIVVGAVGRPDLNDSNVSDVTDLNLTAVSERIKQHCAIAEQESSNQVKQDVLTADDLRESETKGPMELSDLLASRVKK
ncbi:unnamed protein product [Hyaloperonospora brassicae]|uniref:Uncharacterized protein n=1 Tax=Hyaloperonospora brassicae TaxID=162125 RepID=A0AAV0THZ2_HYABA|nr:unnamed protein product [Hyaloperonospora brassicae]